jgi:predicted RNA binding protein YcfA (HicA-like mRNA interferase family)
MKTVFTDRSIRNLRIESSGSTISPGWRHMRTAGSHRQFQHSVKRGTVTAAGKPGIDMPPGTLSSILTSAGLKKPWERSSGVPGRSGERRNQLRRLCA